MHANHIQELLAQNRKTPQPELRIPKDAASRGGEQPSLMLQAAHWYTEDFQVTSQDCRDTIIAVIIATI